MPGPAWGEDGAADEAVISTNLVQVVRGILAAAPRRDVPTVALAQQWHHAIYRGTASPPRASYVGAFRGGADPDLHDYDVVLRDRPTGRVLSSGAPAADVAGELARFEQSLLAAVRALDAAIPAGSRPADTQQLLSVIELAAVVHGEWVRIHPFANGNGRVARTWANWVAVRYGLPPFVRIKPRPDGLMYARAAHMSMGAPPAAGPDHSLTVQVFLDLLRDPP
jgi:hypothetical protein